MRDCLIAVFLLAGLSPLSQAKDLGTWGDTWPVAEQSFLALIQTRLATMMNDGTLSALQHQFAQRVEAHALRPVPVAGLKADTREHVSWYDPTFTAEQNIADAQYHIFVHQGDRFNPLDTLSLNLTLYFIDSDDKRQIAWMKAQTPPTANYKIILVNGNVREASDSLASRVYFDQQGVISRRLKLTYIPARVVQDGRRLKITSAALPQE
ncbi:type-F conjugative transfer system protein TraW [Klebsiella variicola]|uniref:type-F conjugative transfer system protein TraW n=1 Tax=Klebsiella variicola TaxID=244366 RepID=UPI000D74D733|nr:type-F conjugative transfer system protein TraW [Klebsiella variicola]EIY5102112.1 type-F conjugative transfer system protein TraW [Klebsiella variicola]EIY5154371.1 type-F conjugative transfer system protein TraW [Klebsiella variicola]EKW2092875.1 type-F conjugative transfer system protein TraW [Klebsiella variicola]MDE4678690.1 type-F conjugative transfer system protein TraW [Klebsiella variicola]PXL02037.1 type-F conjugative transfer system protein TraW [Klebsiella variicola]